MTKLNTRRIFKLSERALKILLQLYINRVAKEGTASYSHIVNEALEALYEKEKETNH